MVFEEEELHAKEHFQVASHPQGSNGGINENEPITPFADR
jgi:hypothetical protein